MKKFFAVLIAAVLMLSLAVPVGAVGSQPLSEDIVILYTNDVHTYIDGPLSYDVLAAIKGDLLTRYKHVLLADAGDHIQGTAYGSMDRGQSVIELMNAAGYDVATLGNHEFDYGMDGCMNVMGWADFAYTSANFYHEREGARGETVLAPYVLFDCGEEKIAFVGITTPETFTKSTPAYFQDEDGNYIYGISAGDDCGDMRRDVQAAIDAAYAAGATCVIALGHLGMDTASSPWTSPETIAGVRGLDAFIDGHSHHTVEGQTVRDLDGQDVLLTQTGEYFGRIGMMVVDAETGRITTDFIECREILGEDGETVEGYTLESDLYEGTELIFDQQVKDAKEAWQREVDALLGVSIGSTGLTLDNYDSEGNRLVRVQETNTGDFAADALYYLFDGMGLDVDLAIMNGGGVRNQALTGQITYKVCKEIHTFGNVACLQTVTGQQILDALEWGARLAGEGENGGFLQVSGLTYKIDTAIPDTTQKDDKGIWIGGPTGEYRVHDVTVYNKETGTWDALDLTATYNLAGYNYTLRDLGDGFAMFEGAVNILDYVMEDYMVLANYVQGFAGGTVGAENSPLAVKYDGFAVNYGSVNGSGRITVAAKASVPDGGETTAEETTAEETSAEETSGEETTAGETSSDKGTGGKGGCSSVILGGMVLMLILPAGALLVRSRKENE